MRIPFSILEISESANKYKVIGFDCFDTIVHRKCNAEDVLYRWSKCISEYTKFQYETLEIYKLRKKSEKFEKKRRCKEEISYDDLMRNIHSSMKLSISFEEFLIFAKNCELKIEKECIEADKEAIELISKLSHNRLVIVSDFYFGAEMLSEVLSDTGLIDTVEHIYVSSDVGVRKDTGNLFKYVLEDLKIKPADFLFIGDNIKSDVLIPESMGIDVFFKKNTVIRREHLKKTEIWNELQCRMCSTENENLFNGFLAPMLIFCDNLYRETVQNDITDIFFLSREGQKLKQIFDIYIASQRLPKKIETHYLYISRKAVAVAALDDVENENFAGIFNRNTQYTVNDFLAFLGFEKLVIAEILDRAGISKDDLIMCFGKKQAVYQILQKCGLFRSEYERIRNEQKKLFLEYLNQFPVKLSERGMTIVDIGWKGTMQDSLRKVLPVTISIKGYYMGIYDNNLFVEKCIESDNSQKKGLVFTTHPKPNKEYYAFRKNRILWEFVYCANHGPVEGYHRINDAVAPIIGVNKEDLENCNAVQPYWDKTIAIFQTSLQYLMNSPFDVHSFAGKLAEEYIYFTTQVLPKRMPFFYRLLNRYQDNFIKGSSTVKRKSALKILRGVQYRLYSLFGGDKQILDVLYAKKMYLLFLAMSKVTYRKSVLIYRLKSGVENVKKVFRI